MEPVEPRTRMRRGTRNGALERKPEEGNPRKETLLRDVNEGQASARSVTAPYSYRTPWGAAEGAKRSSRGGFCRAGRGECRAR